MQEWSGRSAYSLGTTNEEVRILFPRQVRALVDEEVRMRDGFNPRWQRDISYTEIAVDGPAHVRL